MIAVGECQYSEDTITTLGKFAILWNMFENEKFDKYCTKDKIKNKTYDITINNDIILFMSNLKMALINYLTTPKLSQKSQVVKMFYDNNDINVIENHVYEYLNDKPLSDEDKLQGCLFVCLRLRNNLFHGIKDKYSLDDQVKIFKALNNLLEYIVKE